eukprot:CAMPEP_0177582202 /NCGR_PEP_ID=MMETSP0419_2-20121207/2599_1 /TAXON_ID=582737 /ORGANISM="Tetraselmis sp., Strain GSL018" /LENGTH=317 /DNA_ID=CAMNT_0019071383 /DNA_START=282 /DNA_END=1231 /DNA_ORIENTATION=+
MKNSFAPLAGQVCGKDREEQERFQGLDHLCATDLNAWEKFMTDRNESIIVSSEGFGGCSKDGFEWLLKFFGRKYSIQVVVLYRELQSHLISRYSQHLQSELWQYSGVKSLFEYYFGATHRCEEISCAFVGDGCVHMLSQVFGPENIHVVNYHGLKERHVQLYEFICDEFSSNCYDSQPLEANKSPALQIQSAQLIFNRLSIAAGCGKKLGNLKWSSASLNFTEAFSQTLLDLGVKVMCVPASYLPDVSCGPLSVKELLRTEVNLYYFGESYSDQRESYCLFEESSLYMQSANEGKTIAEIVIDKHVKPLCSGPGFGL